MTDRYDEALLDVAEKINNARKNGYREHWDTEILDILLELSHRLTAEDILSAGD